MSESKMSAEFVRQLGELVVNYAVELEDTYGANLEDIKITLDRIKRDDNDDLTTIVKEVRLAHTTHIKP